MTRAWAFLLCLVILTSLVLPVKASNRQFPCEQYISFVNPEDAWAKEWLAEELSQKELQHWPVSYKRAVCDAFCQIQRKASGLVARTCNGEKIRMVLSRDRSCSTSSPLCISCSIQAFKEPGLHELLVHELVHSADTDQLLSNSHEWNRLVGPYLQRFRAKQKVSDNGFLGTVNPLMACWKLPSPYAASNPTEALAEYTAAMVIGNWDPPNPIRSFISENVLKKPDGIESERDLLRQAYAQAHKGNCQQCLNLCTQLLRLDDSCEPALSWLAAIWLDRSEPEIALFHATQALQLLGRNGALSYSCHVQLYHEICGRSYYKLGHYQTAIDYFSKAISAAPNDALLYQWRGLAYHDLKQHKKAINNYDKAISLNSRNARVYCYRGTLYDELGRKKRALDNFNKAIALSPNCASAYNYRGYFYGKQRSYRKATDDCNKAISLDPRYAYAYDTRGYILGRQGQYQKAIDEFTTAINLDSNCDAAYYHRAKLYEKMGKKHEATRDREIAKTLGYKPDPDE